MGVQFQQLITALLQLRGDLFMRGGGGSDELL